MSDQEQGEKSFEPTQYRLEKAIEQGDVAKSVEVSTWFVLGGLTLSIMVSAGSASRDLGLALKRLLESVSMVSDDGAAILVFAREGMKAGLAALTLPFLLVFCSGIMGGLIQHRLLWSLQPLMPQLSRISPGSGFKRVFGPEAFVNFIKGLLKLSLVGALVGWTLWSERDRLEAFSTLNVAALLPAISHLILKLMGGVLALFAVVAVLDFVYQRFSWLKRQRMTQRDLKEEYKETEGSPEIKAKIKQLRVARAKRRMMANVPKASVIITNPTHYAIALQYDRAMPAPVCLAKGLDAVALRIKLVAEKNDIPIIENPPLARALYATVELDEEIPVEHYKAVAEIIGYVLRLRHRAT